MREAEQEDEEEEVALRVKKRRSINEEFICFLFCSTAMRVLEGVGVPMFSSISFFIHISLSAAFCGVFLGEFM